jgi:hypothetical protein
VRVVHAELPATVVPQHALQQRAEDGRVDLAPVELLCVQQQPQLILVQRDLGRLSEQLSVDVGRAGQQSGAVVVARLVQNAEEEADLGGGGALWIRDEP